jgi:hypothetical protein
MGYVKEPAGIDLVVSPMPLSNEDRAAISAIIKNYKLTGEMPINHKDLGKKKTTKSDKLTPRKARKIATVN